MPPTYLTYEEAAELTRRSERALRALVAQNKIPHRKLPGVRRVLFPRAELEAWLDGAQLETSYPVAGGRVVRPRGEALR